MGKASFVELQDSKGRIQVYITRDDICPDDNKDLYNTVFKKLMDIGDFIGIKGFVFQTQTGESEDFMVMNRNYERDEKDDSLISDLSTYIDPSKYNQIFADTSLSAQNFWVQTAVQIEVRRNISAKQIPNL